MLLPQRTSRREITLNTVCAGVRGDRSRPCRHPFTNKGNLKRDVSNPHGEDISLELLKRLLEQAGISEEGWGGRLTLLNHQAVPGPMHANQVAEIAERHGVLRLLLFGSLATGTVHARCDVDLAALLDRTQLSLRDHASLLDDLQGQFPGQEVDLAILNHADPLFLKKIMEPCRLVYRDPRRLQPVRIYALKRYHDHRKYRDMERRFVARSLAAGRPDG